MTLRRPGNLPGRHLPENRCELNGYGYPLPGHSNTVFYDVDLDIVVSTKIGPLDPFLSIINIEGNFAAQLFAFNGFLATIPHFP